MESYGLMIVLRVVHILGGIFWVGAALFSAFFLFPTIREAGPQGGRVMQLLMQRKLPVYMNIISGLTMLSGFVLYWRMISMSSAWAGSRPGMVFGLGGALTVLAAIVGGGVNARAGKKLGALGAEIQASGGPPSAEQAATMNDLQKRLRIGMILATTFLVSAAICMAIGRYM